MKLVTIKNLPIFNLPNARMGVNNLYRSFVLFFDSRLLFDDLGSWSGMKVKRKIKMSMATIIQSMGLLQYNLFSWYEMMNTAHYWWKYSFIIIEVGVWDTQSLVLLGTVFSENVLMAVGNLSPVNCFLLRFAPKSTQVKKEVSIELKANSSICSCYCWCGGGFAAVVAAAHGRFPF